MRRRRHLLQVSTFPFLAVLLCTMGSLIFILMVVDRRARIVARARALREVNRLAEERLAAERARKEDWERRRRALRDMVQDELAQVKHRSVVLQEKTVEIARRRLQLETEQAGQRARIEAEQADLARVQREWNRLLDEQAWGTQDASVHQAELGRLFADLEALEKVLAHLKAVRARQAEAFSLVPYRGKHGDKRRPIYLECAASGIVFHPGRILLEGSNIAPMAIRSEVDRRLPRQGGAGTDQSPYLLVLLRPSGIENYYRILAALEGLSIDFGYEFIDEGWVLDFPEDGSESVRPQPWMTGGSAIAGTSTAGSGTANSVYPGQARAGGGRPGVDSAGSGNGPGSGQRHGAGDGGHPAATLPGAVLGSPLPGPAPAGGPFQPPFGHAGREPRLSAVRSGERPNPDGGGASRTQGNSLPLSGVLETVGPTIGGVGRPAPVADGREAASSAGNSLGSRSPLQSPLFPGNPDSNVPGKPGTSALGGSTAQSQTESTRGGSTKAGEPGCATPGGATVPSGPASTPGDRNEQSQAAQASPGGATTAGESGASAPGGSTVPGEPGSPGDSSVPGEPGRSASGGSSWMGPRQPDVKPARPPRLSVNRDWVIPVECTADAVLLPSLGERIPLAALQVGPAGKNPLLLSVRQMIERKQGTVRPGEPDYHPQIRFLVDPDGLRAYYLAYPALETLKVPMTRAFKEAQDEGEPKRR